MNDIASKVRAIRDYAGRLDSEEGSPEERKDWLATIITLSSEIAAAGIDDIVKYYSDTASIDKPKIHLFHNPDGLSDKQVGDGHRLLLLSEVHWRAERDITIQAWLKQGKKWSDYNGLGSYGGDRCTTFRVPLTTWPLPK